MTYTYERVTSQICTAGAVAGRADLKTRLLCMGHVMHMDGSWHTYEGVMSHICPSPVTHENESCHIYE